MGLQKQMPRAHSPCIVCYLKATLWFVSRACFRSLELRYTRKVTRFLGVLENLEKYIFSMLTIFFSYYFHTSGFNPWKPAGTYFSNLFCKAFWIKWFRPKPYKSIKWPVLISAFPTPPVSVCICWDWCWRFVGCLRGHCQESRPCYLGILFPGVCSGGSSVSRPLQTSAPSSCVLSEESCLASTEDTQVIPGASSVCLVYLKHVWNMTAYLKTHSQINEYNGNV